MYWVVACGLAVTVEHVVQLSPAAGAQAYVVNPFRE